MINQMTFPMKSGRLAKILSQALLMNPETTSFNQLWQVTRQTRTMVCVGTTFRLIMIMGESALLILKTNKYKGLHQWEELRCLDKASEMIHTLLPCLKAETHSQRLALGSREAIKKLQELLHPLITIKLIQ